MPPPLRSTSPGMTRLNPRDDDEEMRRVSRYMRMVRAKGLNNEIGVRMIGYDAMRVASSVLRGFLQSQVVQTSAGVG